MTLEQAKQHGKQGLMALLVLGVVYFVGKVRGCIQARNNAPAVTLKPTEQEKLILDPTHHTIVMMTHKGTTATTLSDRPSTVTIGKDGSVSVVSPQFGYEQRPFIGGGYSDAFRLMAGCDLFFFKRLDVGPVVTFKPYHPFASAAIGVVVSYTIWSNTRGSVGIDNTRQIVGAFTVRL